MKKVKNFTVISIICCLFYCNNCSLFPGAKVYPIWVYNKSDHYIDILLSHGYPIFPDTLLPDRFYDRPGSVKPGAGKQYPNGQKPKEFIQSYGSDTIIVFIFHTDTLEKYPWNEVRTGYKILKRYDVSWQEMERLEGRLYYPPTEAMKDMKMYPPYGSE